MKLPMHKGPGVARSAMRLLEVDELAYHNAQFEFGLAYLKHNLPAYLDLRYSRQFWRYYINQWALIEVEFLDAIAECLLEDTTLIWSASADPAQHGMKVSMGVDLRLSQIRALWATAHAAQHQHYYPNETRLRMMVRELKYLSIPTT